MKHQRDPTACRPSRSATAPSAMALSTALTCRVPLDIDATLTRVHSEKEDAIGNYKRSFGFHSVACFADRCGEALAVEHRPGAVTGDAVNEILVRSDSAGHAHGFL